MSRTTKIAGLTVVCIVAGIAGATYALFRGYFDRGLFEIKETQWSSSGQVAMVAKRSDHEALNSDDYYVLIGDHVFNASELRRAYYSDRPVFSGADDCLRVSWKGPQTLLITCYGTEMKPGRINHLRQRAGTLAIEYANIPVADSKAKW